MRIYSNPHPAGWRGTHARSGSDWSKAVVEEWDDPEEGLPGIDLEPEITVVPILGWTDLDGNGTVDAADLQIVDQVLHPDN